MKKYLSIILVLCLLLTTLALSACGGQSPSATTESAPAKADAKDSKTDSEATTSTAPPETTAESTPAPTVDLSDKADALKAAYARLTDDPMAVSLKEEEKIAPIELEKLVCFVFPAVQNVKGFYVGAIKDGRPDGEGAFVFESPYLNKDGKPEQMAPWDPDGRQYLNTSDEFEKVKIKTSGEKGEYISRYNKDGQKLYGFVYFGTWKAGKADKITSLRRDSGFAIETIKANFKDGAFSGEGSITRELYEFKGEIKDNLAVKGLAKWYLDENGEELYQSYEGQYAKYDRMSFFSEGKKSNHMGGPSFEGSYQFDPILRMAQQVKGTVDSGYQTITGEFWPGSPSGPFHAKMINKNDNSVIEGFFAPMHIASPGKEDEAILDVALLWGDITSTYNGGIPVKYSGLFCKDFKTGDAILYDGSIRYGEGYAYSTPIEVQDKVTFAPSRYKEPLLWHIDGINDDLAPEVQKQLPAEFKKKLDAFAAYYKELTDATRAARGKGAESAEAKKVAELLTRRADIDKNYKALYPETKTYLEKMCYMNTMIRAFDAYGKALWPQLEH